MNLTDEDIQWAGNHVQKLKLLTYRNAADILSEKYKQRISRDQLRSAIRRRYGSSKKITPLAETLPAGILHSPKARDLSPPITVEDSRVLVMADLHAHYVDADFLQRALDTFASRGGGTVIIAGDLFDFSPLGRFPKTEKQLTVDEELEVVANILHHVANYARHIVICNGNHDERFAQKLDSAFTLSRLVAAALYDKPLACPLTVTEYDYVFYGESWVIGHLSSFSRRPGEVARRIASKYRRHTAVGHDHIQGFTTTQDGAFLAISLGCMVSTSENGASSLWYKERRLNDYSPVANGFLIIDNTVPYLFNKQGYSALNGGASWDSI